MKGSKTVKTPVNTGTKLVKAMGEDECVEQQLYQSAKSIGECWESDFC